MSRRFPARTRRGSSSRPRRTRLYLTGFVQNGALFEVVNLVDPKPYDEQQAVRGMTATLGRLSAHAREKNAGDDAS
ncbi:hypothetical protein G5V59_15785 [Nocardioides sp. W3-2-3]|uniref:hypothetical protein n=1 Tax=Nocardioides convexus TaxID=2712224 RepID=UPI0024187B26|nr:hypothetical protein [Nocardioides convexus]NHA00887.1 hypothetical protein [Nocardioides convexus]